MLRTSLPATLLCLGALAQGAQHEWHLDRGFPGDFRGRLAYDEARERTVLFGSVGHASARRWRYSSTFEWDGAHWIHRHTGPTQLLDAVMCYDSVRRRVVRTCGTQDWTPTGATFEWDGATWIARQAGGLPARTFAAGTFHAASGRVVVFGGIGPTLSWNLLGDTWQLSGLQWSMSAGSGPGPRTGHGMAYDGARQRSTLFGGAGPGLVTSNLQGDTWVWDGLGWQQRQPTRSPSPRTGASLAFDAVRQRIVLFGGSDYVGDLADTWEWDGVDWAPVGTVHQPSARADAAMAYDHRNGLVLLFGGQAQYERLTDTWCYDGTDWLQLAGLAAPPVGATPSVTYVASRQRLFVLGADGRTYEGDGRTWSATAPQPSPTPRLLANVAFDAWRDRVVLYGGRSTYPTADTWEWDGVGWQQRNPPVSPIARIATAMAFDPLRGVVVLFGGQSLSQGALADTWEWNGIAWQQRTTAHTPTAGGAHAMVGDPQLGRIVLFGGSDQNGARSDTWHYDGIDWQQVGLGTAAPPPRYDHAMAFDASRGRTLLFGGGDLQGGLFADLWEWDGVAWAAVSTPSGPPAQTGARLVYDQANRRLVLFGGYSMSHLEHAWWLAPGRAAAATSFGAGCAAGVVPRLRADDPFHGNAGCSVELIDTAAARPAVLVGSLSPAGVPVLSCVQLLQQPFVTAVATTNGHGVARFPVPVPANPSLRDATVLFQAVVFDGTGPLGGASMTAGIQLRVGH